MQQTPSGKKDSTTHRETAVDELGGGGESSLTVEGLAELLDEKHLRAGAGHLVRAEELESLGEGLDAEVLDELGDGAATGSLGHDVLHLLAEANLTEHVHGVLVRSAHGERLLRGRAGGGGLGEDAARGDAGGHGGGAGAEGEGVEGHGGHLES